MNGYSGPLEAGDWRCPSCGNDPADPSLHMEGCRLTPLTAQDWADLVEAIRPATAWSDYGETVDAHLLDQDDAEFAMRTLAPVVARIAERAEADLAAAREAVEILTERKDALAERGDRLAADLADEKRRCERLVDLCSKVIAVHAEVEMDTPEDKTLHAKAVATFSKMLALFSDTTTGDE